MNSMNTKHTSGDAMRSNSGDNYIIRIASNHLVPPSDDSTTADYAVRA